jgi:hypothetical protein
MSGHINRNTSVGRVMGVGLGPWPTHPSGSASKPTNIHHSITKGRPIMLVLDFVSNPEDYLASLAASEYGYQEVHKIYDKMRAFSLWKELYQNEVAIIKFTLMTMKPNCRNPQMVMVSKNLACSNIWLNVDKIIIKDIMETISGIPLHIGDTTGISTGTVAAKFVVLFLQIMVIIAP